MTDISGRVAFITGAASGLGLSMATAFAARGAKLMLTDRDEAGLAAAAALIKAQGGEVATAICDVTDIEAVRAAAEATLAAFGKVHIVVNNAGVATGGAPGDTPIEDWRWIIDINLMGVVHGVEVFTPILKRQGEGGHFVNTASLAGHGAAPGMGPYTATKFAVVGYSEGLKLDLAEEGIGVSILCPAWVRTKIHTTALGRPSAAEVSQSDAEENAAYQGMAAVINSGIDADTVGEWTADCVEADRLYIFTHPEFMAAIDHRYAAIKADYEAAAADGRLSAL
ncbi:MAG: SDR family NAD(P)-dependent oxidoreductase [Pseudomonadota bacterium]